jgi:hypothetical protein
MPTKPAPARRMTPEQLVPKEQKETKGQDGTHNFEIQCPSCSSPDEKGFPGRILAGPFPKVPSPDMPVQCDVQTGGCGRVHPFKKWLIGFTNSIQFIGDPVKCPKCGTSFQSKFKAGNNTYWRGCPGPKPKEGEEAVGCGCNPPDCPRDETSMFALAPAFRNVEEQQRALESQGLATPQRG